MMTETHKTTVSLPAALLVLLGALPCSAEQKGAPLEDFKVELKTIKSGFKAVLDSESKVDELRTKVFKAWKTDGRVAAINDFLKEREQSVVKTHALLKKWDKVIENGEGLDFTQQGGKPGEFELIAGLTDDMRQGIADLESLGKEVKEIFRDVPEEENGLLLNLKRTQSVMTKMMQKLGDFDTADQQGKVNKEELLKALKVARAATMMLQQKQVFEYKFMAVAGKVENVKERVRSVWDAAFQGLNVRDYFTGFAQEVNDSAEFVSKMVKLMEADPIFDKVGVIDSKGLADIADGIRKIPEPIVVDGEDYFFSKEKQVWYRNDLDKDTSEFEQVYAPYCYDCLTGKYMKLHEDGKWYCHGEAHGQTPLPFGPDGLPEGAKPEPEE